MCSLLEKIYISKYKSKKKRLRKKREIVNEKTKKRGAYKQQLIALFVCGAFCLVLVHCYLLYLFPSLIYHKLVLGTRIGQQLGQVLWTFIQYCYLLLTYVPHTYIYSFVCLPRSTYILQIGTEKGSLQSWFHTHLVSITNQPPVVPSTALHW